MKKLIAGALSVAALTAASSATAGLLGESVTGTLRFGIGSTNYFDPANGFVPAGCLNSSPGTATVVIGDPAVEFCFQDGANRDVANFGDGSLVITDDVFINAANWTMTFTSLTAGLFTSLSLVTDTFVPGLTYGLSGDTITVQWAGTGSPAAFRAEFSIGTAASVPEPGTLALFGLGLAGFAAVRRRKQ